MQRASNERWWWKRDCMCKVQIVYASVSNKTDFLIERFVTCKPSSVRMLTQESQAQTLGWMDIYPARRLCYVSEKHKIKISNTTSSKNKQAKLAKHTISNNNNNKRSIKQTKQKQNKRNKQKSSDGSTKY